MPTEVLVGAIRDADARRSEHRRELSALTALLAEIKVKLSTFKLAPYDPPTRIGPAALEQAWRERVAADRAWERDVRSRARAAYADAAERLAESLARARARLIAPIDADISVRRSSSQPPLTSQVHVAEVQRLQTKLPPLDALLDAARSAWATYEALGIRDLDGTDWSVDDLAAMLEQLRIDVRDRLALLDQQRTVRKAGQATPAQLDEWASVFRHFDVNRRNALDVEVRAHLFTLALTTAGARRLRWCARHGARCASVSRSVSLSGQDAALDRLHGELAAQSGRDGVSFEVFIRFMAARSEDVAPEQVRSAFASLSGGAAHLSAIQLSLVRLPPEVEAHVRELGGAGADGAIDYRAYLDRAYA